MKKEMKNDFKEVCGKVGGDLDEENEVLSCQVDERKLSIGETLSGKLYSSIKSPSGDRGFIESPSDVDFRIYENKKVSLNVSNSEGDFVELVKEG